MMHGQAARVTPMVTKGANKHRSISESLNMAAAWALIIDNGAVLMIQRANSTSRPNQWCLPGGGIKFGENAAAACVREVKEETGLDVDVRSQLAQASDGTYFCCLLLCDRRSMSLCSDECQDAVWCPSNEILDLGPIMDLSRLIPLLRLAGLKPPPVPDGLVLNEMD